MIEHRRSSVLTIVGLAWFASLSFAQPVDPGAAMHWRHIGPTRAGRARAVAGVASQPNVAYIGFDNGGVWRSTDYGSNWTPIFDRESTGSIGAIAVAPSDPKVIYVGTGAGIIRPDLATGNGVYKSTDAGRTWTRLGLPDSQMIAPSTSIRGIPTGSSSPRSATRTARARSAASSARPTAARPSESALQGRVHERERRAHRSRRPERRVRGALGAAAELQRRWGVRRHRRENGGIFKSTDGGTTWKPLTEGLPNIVQANLAVARAIPRSSTPWWRAAAPGGGGRGGRGGRGGGGGVGLDKSIDGGEHWFLAVRGRMDAARGAGSAPARAYRRRRPSPVAVDPRNENVVYSFSVVLWRSEDGGVTWTAVRGAPGGDDYQKMWINPNNSDILVVVTDQGAVVSANRGESWSNWYTQPTAAMYHASTDNAFPYRVCSGQQDSGSACVDSRGNDGEITFRDWRPVNIQEYGEAAPDPKNPDLVYGSSRTGVTLYDRRTGQTKAVGPAITPDASGTAYNRNVRTMPLEWSPVNPKVLFYAQNAVYRTDDGGGTWTRISGDLARQAWEVPANAGRYASGVTPGPQGAVTALSPSPLDENLLWAGTDDGNIQVMNGAAQRGRTSRRGDQAVDADLQHRGGALRQAHRVRGGQHDAPRRPQPALLPHARRRQDVD